jgi:hypothetical protein
MKGETNVNRRIIFGVLLALVLIAGAVSLGTYVYNAGVAQGLVESGKLTDLPPGAEAKLYPYYGGPFGYHRPFGFGFFGCLGPLLFFLLFFGLFRWLWWGGPWGWGRGWKHGYEGRGVPPMFEEWHRQAHSQGVEPTPPPSAGS